MAHRGYNRFCLDLETHQCRSGTIRASFADGLGIMRAQGYQLITPPDYISLQTQHRDQATLREGTWISAGVVWFPHGKPKLVLASPLYANPQDVMGRSKSTQECMLSPTQIDELAKRWIDFPTRDSLVPLHSLDSNELVTSLVPDTDILGAYISFLYECGVDHIAIKNPPRTWVNQQQGPFLRQLRITGSEVSPIPAITSEYGRYGSYASRGIKFRTEKKSKKD